MLSWRFFKYLISTSFAIIRSKDKKEFFFCIKIKLTAVTENKVYVNNPRDLKLKINSNYWQDIVVESWE